jgi:hypothetical protein
MLIETMTQQKANGYWGDNNPKLTAWVACQKALEGSELESGGAPKSMGAIKSQWQKVCPRYVYVCVYNLQYSDLQLKQEYDIVKELWNLSGVGWDDMKKCVKVNLSVWTDYCKVCLTTYMWVILVPHTCSPPQSHPKAKPFCKKGFPLFDKIGNLIDSTHATGEFAFQAGQTLGPSNTCHSSPATPPGDDFDPQIDPILLGLSHNTTCSLDTIRPHTLLSWENNRYLDSKSPIEVSVQLL